ncbi:uncharacterized protein LOC110933223 [Helianthus annuus]|uniref:uncharacterized protein LOC110933223 n=1 Tax=Helianthus annuus TaxID=4232 RepID=UPI000B8FAFD5|nr:uncharacterized protein LOC110933223 [Helianthus annuus]
MDPCPYIRIVVRSLGLKFTGAGDVAPLSSAAYCKIKLKNYPTQLRFIRVGKVIRFMGSGKLLGVVMVGLDSEAVEGGGGYQGCVVVRNGWVGIGDRCSKSMVNLHLSIGIERDPRFVFEFYGEPECSPKVFQVNGNVRQAVFTSKFSFRSNRDQNLRSE